MLPLTLNYGAPVNWQAPLNRGLVGWWKVLPLRMGTVKWQALTGPTPATLINMSPSSATVGWGGTTRRGGYGELRGNGTSSRMEVADVLRQRVQPPLSISCAFRLTATSTNQGLITRNNAAGNWWTGLHYLQASAALQWTMQDPTSGQSPVWSGPAISAGTWYHVTVVVRGFTGVQADVDMYLNGIKQSVTLSGTYTSAFAWTYSASPWMFGARAEDTPSFWLGGKLDDIALRATGLSDRGAMQLAQASKLGAPEELAWRRLPFGVTAPATYQPWAHGGFDQRFAPLIAQ